MRNERLIPGLILILLGVGFLFDFSIWRIIWPLFFIFLGLMILRGGGEYKRGEENEVEESKEGKLDEEMFFGSINKRIKTEDFGGGRVVVLFGGGTLDLREAKIASEKTVELEVVSIFGGLKIMVPKGWVVSTAVVGVFGGFGNETEIEGKESGKLRIKGAAVFGGGEVTN